MKIDLPKDKLDEALMAEIGRLTRVNGLLKAKVTRLEAQWSEHESLVMEVREIRRKFKDVIDEYADHEDCSGG